jgi:hypothetical protein
MVYTAFLSENMQRRLILLWLLDSDTDGYFQLFGNYW